MVRKLAIASDAESDCFLRCGSSTVWQMDLSCMVRELAIVRAEMYPSVPHSFQTLVLTHDHAGSSSLISDLFNPFLTSRFAKADFEDFFHSAIWSESCELVWVMIHSSTMQKMKQLKYP
jgi:hypothetical protein